MSRSFAIAGRCKGAFLFLLAIILTALPTRSDSQPVGTASTQKVVKAKLLRDRAQATAQALQQGWLLSTAGATTWSGINAWQRFVIVDALAQYTELTGDRSYLPQIERAVANHDGLDGNDDDLWAVIASLHVYRLNQSSALLQFSTEKFKILTDQYWDWTCGGGMWWDHERKYKNAITNELLLYAATVLYRATNDPSYSAWAHKEWDWFSRSGMINSNNLVNDGLDAECRNNGGTTYTYNQGVVLGGLVNLYLIDGDSSHIRAATSIAQATIASLTRSGILYEPATALNQDGQTFKGIFVYYLGDLVPFAHKPQVRAAFSNFLARNADSVWAHRQVGENKLNAYWDGKTPLYGAAAQASGLDLLDAAFRAINAP
jgi:predicted alpha-1,6-mannanase (GH76 family)